MRKLLAGGITTIVLVGTGIGVAAASVPDSSGTIHGCVSKVTKTLKVIDSDLGQTCNSLENPLNWQQSAPATSFYYVQSALTLIDSGTTTVAIAVCNDGDTVVGGGFEQRKYNTGIPVEIAEEVPAFYYDPVDTPNAWQVKAYNPVDSSSNSFSAIAMCEHTE